MLANRLREELQTPWPVGEDAEGLVLPYYDTIPEIPRHRLVRGPPPHYRARD